MDIQAVADKCDAIREDLAATLKTSEAANV
jgi:hypothetical protein